LANQTLNGGPEAALGGELSYLPGQRLSACTCAGEAHPGPIRRDGSFAGRAAPEIDVLEALVTVETRQGEVSQSVSVIDDPSSIRLFTCATEVSMGTV
jgi:hypothetical protein